MWQIGPEPGLTVDVTKEYKNRSLITLKYSWNDIYAPQLTCHLGLNKYSCIIIWNAVVTAAIFLHLRWQRKNTHRGSFPAFLDRAIWYTLSKVVLQPQRSPYSLRAIIAVVIFGMPRSTSCATKCKATLQVQWQTHTWKSPYLLYGLALNVSLGGGLTVHSMKLPIFSKVRHRFQAYLFRGNSFKP